MLGRFTSFACLMVTLGALAEAVVDVCDHGGRTCSRGLPLVQLSVRSRDAAKALLQEDPEGSISSRFCGIASNREGGNEYDGGDLHAASVTGLDTGKMWHYNWLMASDVIEAGVEYVPMIKEPGHTLGRSIDELPAAFENHIGGVVKGWNEPDDTSQAGQNYDLRSLRDPKLTAQQWTEDMSKARAKGYKEFIGPAMAHDVCWLDHFLKACEETSGCRDLITYLSFHRYRADCASYVADSNHRGWREDLSYVLSFYNLMRKYNQKGFNIKGLVWDELGCFTSDWRSFAPESEQMQYMSEWYNRTVVGVKLGDEGIAKKIRDTDWIMPVGAYTANDAHTGPGYTLGQCKSESGGPTAGLDAVRALRSIATMAWFSIEPKSNHLFTTYRGRKELSRLGDLYFGSCRRLASVPVASPAEDEAFVEGLTSQEAVPKPGAEPTATPSATTCDEAAWPDKDHDLVCGECKVLVDRFDSYYKTCDRYCADMGRQCVGAWEEQDDNCIVKFDMACDQALQSSDAICQCGNGVIVLEPTAEPTAAEPTRAPDGDTACDATTWPDKDHGLVCGDCKVLVDRFDSYYKTCDGYCSELGRQCIGAWEEQDDDCQVKFDMVCDQAITSSDAICQCGAVVTTG